MPPRVDFTSQRLFVDAPLRAGAHVELVDKQAHYLLTVLRMQTGARLLIFNGQDGEWRAEVVRRSKKAGALTLLEQVRPQPVPNDLWFVFAPIKGDRAAWMVEKAVEMGAGALKPVLTDHGQVKAVRMDRLAAHVTEAAEQCGVLAVPSIDAQRPLSELLASWPAERQLIFCDEHAPVSDPNMALAGLEGTPLAVLIGPEGGFSAAEREQLLALPSCRPIALGPRILRADTAAVAALAAVQMAVGDWR
ncbi:MAG: 16S rRNA (uracil(1498)-N(3))-methyltransferase [Devosiaceae bacterium]|nr:16S rRNA (uracil(1498)-N(3))-methyltransferase [Devosiaceae bacterium MH13]